MASLNKKIIEQACFFLLLCLSIILGIWQLHRGVDKKALETQQRTQQLPSNTTVIQDKQSINEMTRLLNRFVSFSGCIWWRHVWLLENQIVQNKIGYDVITLADIWVEHSSVPKGEPLQAKMLINLGWVSDISLSPQSSNKARIIHQELIKKPAEKHAMDSQPFNIHPNTFNINPNTFNPRLNTFNINPSNTCQPTVLLGRVKAPYDLPFVSNVFSPIPSIVELTPASFPIDHLIKAVYLEIDARHPFALNTHWETSTLNSTPTLSSHRHYGYAFQWFLLAAAIGVYLGLSLKPQTQP